LPNGRAFFVLLGTDFDHQVALLFQLENVFAIGASEDQPEVLLESILERVGDQLGVKGEVVGILIGFG
jgi:hypothetical protein